MHQRAEELRGKMSDLKNKNNKRMDKIEREHKIKIAEIKHEMQKERASTPRTSGRTRTPSRTRSGTSRTA